MKGVSSWISIVVLMRDTFTGDTYGTICQQAHLAGYPLLFLLTIFMFTMIYLFPGGPDQVIFNPHLSAAGRAALRDRFGLDQPVWIQYFKLLGNSLTVNFGFSFKTNQPVGDIIAQRFPATLQLFVPAQTLALVCAILLGVITALRHGTATDYVGTTISYFGMPCLSSCWACSRSKFSGCGNTGFPLRVPPAMAFTRTRSALSSITCSFSSYRCACWRTALLLDGAVTCVPA